MDLPIKLLGLLLILAGIGLILAGLYQSYNIFTGKAEPPKIISLAPIKLVTTNQPAPNLEKMTQDQIAKLIGDSLTKNLFSPETNSKFFNLAIWSMFVFILFSGGGQIAGIGVKLVKN